MTEPINESDVLDQISAWLNSGVAIPEIERRIRELGFSPERVSNLVDVVLAKQTSNATAVQRQKDRVNWLCGIGLCVLGILLIVNGILEFDQYGIGTTAGGVGAVFAGVGLMIRTFY